MKIAFIAPPHLTEYIAPFGTALMGLAHQILESTQLRSTLLGLHRFGPTHKRFLIVDNSMMELGRALPLRDVLRAAGLVAADEVILPDVYRDCRATIELLGESLAKVGDPSRHHPLGPSYMAVPQGNTQDEWLSCYDEIYKLYVPQYVQTIGVPKYLAKDDPAGRIATLQAVQGRWPDRTPKHDWHLLGVWMDPTKEHYQWSMSEPVEIAHLFPWVRSVDTSLPVYGSLGYSARPPAWDSMAFDSVGPAALAHVVGSCLYIRERLEEV